MPGQEFLDERTERVSHEAERDVKGGIPLTDQPSSVLPRGAHVEGGETVEAMS
jgi:hypothetical protein